MRPGLITMDVPKRRVRALGGACGQSVHMPDLNSLASTPSNLKSSALPIKSSTCSIRAQPVQRRGVSAVALQKVGKLAELQAVHLERIVVPIEEQGKTCSRDG
jgi:hypothetical protein